MPPIVCACCVARCVQGPCDFHEALEDHGQNDNCIVELILFKLRARSAVDVGISDRQLEMGASSREVRASMLMRSPLIDSAAPLLARGHASEGLSQHLALRSRKSGPHARTPSSHECRASPLPPRSQDASSVRTRRIPRASGGIRVRWCAPV